tara:strand:+ start:207 stop:521 length:315 start_codon:yes stop_codon:yes gene_type:complete
MKFAIIALVATASAIRVTTQAGCAPIPQGETDGIFDQIDTNHNGFLSMSEGHAALEHAGVPAAKISEILALAKKDAKSAKGLSKKGFNEMANQANTMLDCGLGH